MTQSSGEYEPLLPGIGIEGYRSFAEWQTIAFPTKVTVLAGVNNSGKSNVLRFLQQVLPQMSAGAKTGTPKKPELAALDAPRGYRETAALSVSVRIPLGSRGDRQNLLKQGGRVKGGSLGNYQEAAMQLLSSEDTGYWSRFTLVDGAMVIDPGLVNRALAAWPNWRNSFEQTNRALGGGTADEKNVMTRLLTSIGGFHGLPRVATISSNRRVETTGDTGELDWNSGRGIIRPLAELQNPSHGEWEGKRSQWQAINKFVRTVLGDEKASLNIPYDFSTIQIETPERVLPLASLGSGIEQVIVLASAATVTTSSLVCIEEPETNLHPLLQKKLVRYLTDETDNQYIIATHSSHLLDDARATAYHVQLTTRGSQVRLARKPHELVTVCNDLGYRPSDLMQANCIIWVEGPSDRTYIRHWISLSDPTLAEGIDYSIMFYGGRLLSHLSVDDDVVDDFISLRQLNRFSAVVIDSDKRTALSHINKTKKRIRDEFQVNEPGLAWITKCYTIENYVPVGILQAAVEATKGQPALAEFGQWDNPLANPEDGKKFDKVGIAGEAVARIGQEHLDTYDLRSRVQDLVEFIRAANGTSVVAIPRSEDE